MKTLKLAKAGVKELNEVGNCHWEKMSLVGHEATR